MNQLEQIEKITIAPTLFQDTEFDVEEIKRIKSIVSTGDRMTTLQSLSETMSSVNAVTLEKVKSSELDGIESIIKEALVSIGDINPQTLMSNPKRGIISKLFGQKIKKKINDILTELKDLETTFDELTKTTLQCKETLIRDNQQNDNHLREIQELGRKVMYYIRAIEEVEEDKSIELNRQIDAYNLKLTDNNSLSANPAVVSKREEILSLQDNLHDISNTKTMLYSQLMLHYNNATILRELNKSNHSLSNQLDSIVMYDLPSIKQQVALCVSILRQKNTLVLINKMNDMFTKIVTTNADLLSSNLVELQKLNDMDRQKIETILKTFQKFQDTTTKIKELEKQSQNSNKEIINKCIQNINNFNKIQ